MAGGIYKMIPAEWHHTADKGDIESLAAKIIPWFTDMPNFQVSILAADGLVPQGAGTSADTVMTRTAPLQIWDWQLKRLQ